MYADHFSVKNIPFGIASSPSHPAKSAATRLGDHVIFLDVLAEHGLLSCLPETTIAAFSRVSCTSTFRSSSMLRTSRPSTLSLPSRKPPRTTRGTRSKLSYLPTALPRCPRRAPRPSLQPQCTFRSPSATSPTSPAPKITCSTPARQS